MSLKVLGAVLIILSCGGLGFSLAYEYKRQEYMLLQIMRCLNYMECELQYHLTPLPELCRGAARQTSGLVKEVLICLSEKMDEQSEPDVICCMNSILPNKKKLPRRVKRVFKLLGQSLGRFDLPGQMKGLESVWNACNRELKVLEENQSDRTKSYRTLGICAGTALVIILV